MQEDPSNLSTSDGSSAATTVQEQLDWAHRRIQSLLDESRQLQSEQDQLRSEARRVELERVRLASLLLRAERLVRSMESGMYAMRRSISMQLGYLFTHSIRSRTGLTRFPLQLIRLLREMVRKDRGTLGQERQVVAVPIPQQWFPTALRRELSRFHAEVASSGKPLPAFSEDDGVHGSARRFTSLPEDLRHIRLAAIMDEFTFSAYRECCDVLQITPDDWRTEIDRFTPHLLFVESAWDGKGGAWQRKVSGASPELRQLVQYCRSRGIPVVFWSKEDPVHFKTFLETARLADVVFTTDLDCVVHYRRELGHDRVFALPFATQPRSHNPIERYERKRSACFAGSYYVRYQVRQRDFASLIRAARSTCGVDIYDRNHGKEHPNFIFPEEYRPNILGGLTFDQIDLAYKGYSYGININTVKHSQSMFARRVFDLLASNTTVVSNYSRGMRLMFGDLIVASDDASQLTRRLEELGGDERQRRKLRLAGLRKVLREHTYEHRLAYILDKIFGRLSGPTEPLITVIAQAASDAELARVLGAYHRQAWSRKQLVVCFGNGYVPARSPVEGGVRVLSVRQAVSRTPADLGKDGFVAAFHSEDHYGRHYLTDLSLALVYSDSDAIGKAAYFRVDPLCEDPVLEGDGQQYRQRSSIACRRAIVRASKLHSESVSNWISGIADRQYEGDVLALDEFNYCEGGAAADVESQVGDLRCDEGMPLQQLLGAVETTGAGVAEPGIATGTRDESVGLPGFGGIELFRLLEPISSVHVSAEESGQDLLIRSSLPKGKQVYVYLARKFLPRELRLSDIGRLQLVVDSRDIVDLVLVYWNAAGDKISHSILSSGINVTVSVPSGTENVQIGLRVRAAGDVTIRRLVVEHVPLGIETMVTRGRHLLLAKNYPSYDDLYKHAFVHRRVVEYKRSGLAVDVFRIGSVGLNYYEFDGIDVVYGQADHLRAMLEAGAYESILVHFLDQNMWNVLQEFVDRTRIYVWAHGAEIQSSSRREFDHIDEEDRTRAIALGEQRMRFWRNLFGDPHPNLKLIFVSNWFAHDVFEDVGVALPRGSYEVIHNFIDTDLFQYHEKSADQRLRVLSVRPFESRKYANDVSVAAVLALKDKPFFSQLHFRFIGDGKLFDETMAPLAGLQNVVIEKRFLTQGEIAGLHREYGVFLNPTRMDAQGVSRDEAMASGLVPVTNGVTAIPEFVDATCGILADPEDALAMAAAIERLYADPGLFLRLSHNAARRVRAQSSFGPTITREMALFGGAGVRGGTGF